MRRSLLTAEAPPPAPFTVGDTPIARATAISGSGVVCVDLNNPAPRAGTLTLVQAYVQRVGDATFFCGSLSGTTFTVTGVSSAVTLTNGTQFAVSMPIPAGGYIGLHINDSNASVATDTSGGSRGYLAGAAAPTVNGTYTISIFTGVHSIQGTGS